MSNNTIVLARNPLEPETWTKHEEVESVCDFITNEFEAWPENARIYDKYVATSCDVTPRTPEEVASLEDLEGPVYVVVYPEGPIAIIAAVVAVAAVAASVLLFMPSIPSSLGNTQAGSPNNELAERTNSPRPKGRIPDIYGTVRSTPDLIAVPYRIYKSNQELEVAYMCIGRGEFDIAEIRDDVTPVEDIDGVKVEVYGPGTSPNSGSPQQTIGGAINRDVVTAKRFTSVNGQTLDPSTWVGPFNVQLRNLDRLSINILAPQGMYKNDGEDQTATSVAVQVEVTPLDDAGFASGSAVTYNGTVSGSSTDTDSKGITINCPVSTESGRAQVRVRRTTPEDTAFEGTVVDEVKWKDCYAMAPTQETQIGGDLVSNGAFDDTSAWSLDSGASTGGAAISGGTLNASTAMTADGLVTQDLAADTTSGNTYRLIYSVTVTAGSITPNLGGTDGTEVNVSGRYQEDIVMGAGEDIEFLLPTGFEGSIDDVSVQLVTQVGTTFGDVTTIFAVTQATDGALAVKDRKLNALVTRKLPAKTGTYEFNGALTATQNAADIICSIASDPELGNMPLGTLTEDGGTGQIDVPQIYQAVHDVVDHFGLDEAGQFNYTFDDPDMSFQEMVQVVSTAVFSQAYRRSSVLRIAPELPQDDSILLFNHRNKVPNSSVRTISFGRNADYDGVAFNYIDPTDDASVTLYVPQGSATAVNPLEVEGVGIRGFEHAYLHAWRRWNRLRYHYLTEEFEALQEADILVRFDRILSADTSHSNTLDGSILSQNVLEVELSQEAELDDVNHTYTMFLQLPSGLVEAIPVTQGSDTFHVNLGRAPAETLILEGDASYVTGYIIQQDGDSTKATPMLVSEKDTSGLFNVELSAINYDERYYGNDEDFLATDLGGGTTPSDSTNPGGGSPDPAVITSISPNARNTESTAPSSSALFTATVSGGTTINSYSWGVDYGVGNVVSGGSSVTATLRAYDYDGVGPTTTQFYCDIDVDGTIYREYCTFTHSNTGQTYNNPSDPLSEQT